MDSSTFPLENKENHVEKVSIWTRIKKVLTVQSSKNVFILSERFPDLYNEDGTINLDSASAKKLLEDYEPPKAFDKIGYARSLGGFFYQFFFALIGAIFLAATYVPFLKYFYPWPESKSMANISGVLFLIVNTLFDIPTGYAIERFIGEWRIKDPRKMMMFVRFYIWYQMLTGIILVTSFSIFTLFALRTGDLAWAKWLMIITISRQYPANTGVFLSTIKGLQKFNYESYCNFFNETFIRPAFEYGFVWWGQYVLGANPKYGPILGIAIGYAIGTYVDDFVSMGIAMYYLNKAIKPMGFKLIDMFIPHIDHDVIITSFKFGLIVAIPGLIGSIWGTITTLWWYNMVPAYLTFTALSQLADQLTNLIKRGGGINIKATISEAANNGKKNLTSYYISMSWKFIFFFMFALGAVVVSFMSTLLETLFVSFGAENYVLAAAFIIPNLIATTIEEPNATAENIILGANRPWFRTLLNIFIDISNVFILYISLFIIRVQDGGISVMAWFLPMWVFPMNFVKLIIQWRYINKNIAPVRYKEFYWQAFIAPLIPSVIIYVIAQAWTFGVFPVLSSATGDIVASVISIVFAFVGCLLLLFFPLYGYFGGWDNNSLNIFNEAVEISGPSKYLFIPIKKATNWLVHISPFHNKFKIEWELANKEADELMMERHIKDKLVRMAKAYEGIV